MNPQFAERNCQRSTTGNVASPWVLVAMGMVALIAMAALSIDVVTLYLAREEAQRDAAALAAAREISVSGITGTADPDDDASSWSAISGSGNSVVSLTAQAVAQENSVGGSAATVTVTYSAGTRSGTMKVVPFPPSSASTHWLQC